MTAIQQVQYIPQVHNTTYIGARWLITTNSHLVLVLQFLTIVLQWMEGKLTIWEKF